jgi:hypothetical protein
MQPESPRQPDRDDEAYQSGKRSHCNPRQAAVAYACATFERAEAFVAALTRDLARCAALERETMAILAELTTLAAGRSSPAMV